MEKEIFGQTICHNCGHYVMETDRKGIEKLSYCNAHGTDAMSRYGRIGEAVATGECKYNEPTR